MTPEEADKAQQWAGMDGATAWHMIERHADDWNEIGAMMDAWLRANVLVEREACATVCDDLEQHWSDYKDTALLNGDVDLSNAASGEPRAARAIAAAIRARV